ncbi:MAG: hypothetical protein PHV82_04490, partial [Victivallaceae bacterium]|nr:hypothetical protein [Victivallaceae bacterium]
IGSMMFPEGELQNAGKAFEVPLQGTDMGGTALPAALRRATLNNPFRVSIPCRILNFQFLT